MGYMIAYVMSLPHSGSTLCGSLLGAHSRAFCLGEPWKLPSYARLERVTSRKTALGNACTCGEPDIWHCSFWPRVNDHIRSLSGRDLQNLEVSSTDPAVFRRDNKLLFDSVAAVTGASLLVDSSKRVGRARMLIDADFAPVKIVHLTRDPEGQVFSTMKRTGRGPYRHAVRNALHSAEMARQARTCQSIGVSYEQMASEPRAWLDIVMPHFGLKFEEPQLQWATSVRHNISGNESRATRDHAIRIDRSWEHALKLHQKTYIRFVTCCARRLGGRLEKPGRPLREKLSPNLD